MLPLIDVMAIANSPDGAIGARGAERDRARQSYLQTEQAANNVPPSDRVVVQNVAEPKKAKVYSPRSKTMPIVVFLAVMLATIGLAFLLENLRPTNARAGRAGSS